MQIRLYKPEERKELRATGAHAAWEAAFGRYLDEQGCPLQPQPDNRAAVLDWLLQQAVSFEYRDRGTHRLRTLCIPPSLGFADDDPGAAPPCSSFSERQADGTRSRRRGPFCTLLRSGKSAHLNPNPRLQPSR